MKYRVICLDSWSVHSELSPGRLPDDGIYSILDKSRRGLFGIFRARDHKNLAAAWRRGVPLTRVTPLSFLSSLDAGETREIRRKDFKDLVFVMQSVQRRELMPALVFIENSRLRTVIENRGVMHHEMQSIASTALEAACRRFHSAARSGLRSGGSLQLILKEQKDRLFDQYPDIEEFFRTLSRFRHVIFNSDDLQLAAFMRLLSFRYKNNWILATRPSISKEKRRSGKIRRVLVITNHCGEELPALHSDPDFWNRGIKGYGWKHWAGSLTKDKFEELVFGSGKGASADLVIYRGHSRIYSGEMQWSLGNEGWLSLEPLVFQRYLHLSCFDAANENRLEVLPFVEGVLPFSLFQDRPMQQDVMSLLRSVSDRVTFREAVLSTFSNTEYSYCS